ncbi:CRISPR-associated endonuclease Cas1 [Thermanaerovibrio velox DSM 12556]|uniref:CRISPR-associated endonuclease Cas1 n=1 Tax=Thermanaerovibrio velox DSM 12556 TaxID=926567 RepID=H0UPW7_9BACT|nr:type I-C CRISPR-associated endonuclease Cas1c [Thermanaerovibrio velox]EHM10676.1 CRISPR-associated endonuclease Cas1 [Thermanaerovibrio velox DSM 12556]
MKHLLNTLYVLTQGSYLSRDGETVLVRVGEETKVRVPIHTLCGIVCFGQVSCSPFLMGLCGERGITLSFMTESGRFLARVHGPVSGNVLLRREQYRRADDPGKSLLIARSMVIGKIVNSRTALLRAARENKSGGSEGFSFAASRLAGILRLIESVVDLDTLRGVEGEAARIYFSVFDAFICAQKDDFFFRERSRRPPMDSMNALLSFLYTLLVHDTSSALESVGLDPAVGYLHAVRPGRPSLALDIMEELRPFIADRLALSLVNRRQVKGSGFTRTESGAVLMDDKTRKEVLVAYQERKREEIIHPFIGEKIPIGLIPYVQALLLARHLRGDLDAYPPFRWK